jgi:DNA invertase Pin-like site-specific DNA recombinase
MKRRQKQGNPRLAVGYVRCSKKEQKLSPAAQSEQLEAWASREGIELLAVFFDVGVGGKTPIADRPGLLAALAALPSMSAGTFVAANRSRVGRLIELTRSIEREALKLGAVLRTADGMSDNDDDAGHIQKGVDDLLNELELRRIRARTKAALAVLKARGLRVGSVPYGMQVATDGATLEPSPAEQQVLALVAELHAAGISTRGIARELAVRGVLSRTGRPFSQTQVMRILRASAIAA